MNFEDVILSIILTAFGFSLAVIWDLLRERRKEKQRKKQERLIELKAKIRAIISLKYEIEENKYNCHYLEKIQPRDDVWRQLIWSGRIDLFEDSLYNALDDLYRFIAGIEVDRVFNRQVLSSKSTDLQNKFTKAYKSLEETEKKNNLEFDSLSNSKLIHTPSD